MKITTVTGTLWGGERQTADHHPIATVLWHIPSDTNNDMAVARAMIRTSERLEELAQWDEENDQQRSLHNYAIRMGKRLDHPNERVMFANVTVMDWFTLPTYWEIEVTDENGDTYRKVTSDD